MTHSTLLDISGKKFTVIALLQSNKNISHLSFTFSLRKFIRKMKSVKYLSSLLILMPAMALAENYTIIINGSNYNFSLNEKKLLQVGTQSISLELKKKDFISFVSDNFSFMHSSKYTPLTQNLGDGIYQTVMMTPIGTMVMIQEYTTIDPSLMIDFMISELT